MSNNDSKNTAADSIGHHMFSPEFIKQLQDSLLKSEEKFSDVQKELLESEEKSKDILKELEDLKEKFKEAKGFVENSVKTLEITIKNQQMTIKDLEGQLFKSNFECKVLQEKHAKAVVLLKGALVGASMDHMSEE